MRGGRIWGRELLGRIFPGRKLSLGKRISMKGGEHFLALFKKTMTKINKRKFFTTGSKIFSFFHSFILVI